MKRPALTSHEFEKVWFPIVEMFLEGAPVQTIAEHVEKEYEVQLSREQIYPVIREAARLKHIFVTPPLDLALSRLVGTFANRGEVEVVRGLGAAANDHVTRRAAHVVLGLIKNLGRQRKGKAVHLGIGIGHTTMHFVHRLTALMRSDRSVPPLVVHALATAYSSWDPLETPLASFSAFSDALREVKFVGLFSVPWVNADEYEANKRHAIIRDAFSQAHDIDICVTSLGTSDHEHGYLKNYVHTFGPSGGEEFLNEAGWLGDVQLRPYSAHGPIDIHTGIKPVTLFELTDLVDMVHRGKNVVLMCGPCGRCKRLKLDALLPLLEEPTLRLWSHLIVDSETAENAIAKRQSRTAPPPPPSAPSLVVGRAADRRLSRRKRAP